MRFIGFACALFFAALVTQPTLAQTNIPVDDFFNAIEGQSLLLEGQDMLANDQVSPGALFRIAKPPLHGTLELNGSQWLYTPPAYSVEGLGGTDSFVYGLRSWPHEEVTARVTLRIAPAQIPLSGRRIVAGSDCRVEETFDHLGWYESATAEITLCPLAGSALGLCEHFTLPGGPGLTPLLGDWDGDGCDEPGSYDSSSARIILYQYQDPECVLPGGDCILIEFRDFTWGEPAGAAVVGDWDGDGIDTVGIRHPGGSTTFSLLDDHATWSTAETIEIVAAEEPFPIVLPWAPGDTLGVYDASTRLVIHPGCELEPGDCFQVPLTPGPGPGPGPGPQPEPSFSSELPFVGHWNFDQPIGVSIGIFNPSAEHEITLYAVTIDRPPKIVTIPIDTSGR